MLAQKEANDTIMCGTSSNLRFSGHDFWVCFGLQSKFFTCKQILRYIYRLDARIFFRIGR